MAEVTGGTTSNLCEITPSDLAGNVDNIATRLARLEQVVAELLGVDVSAVQLSDLSQNGGWITGVSWLGCEGWTQTEYGTLIPPINCEGLSEILSTNSGTVTFYGGGFSNVLTRFGTSGDIGTGSSLYIHPTTDATNHVNKGDTKLTDGTIFGGGGGWVSANQANFMVSMYVNLVAGSSPPTGGDVYARMYRLRTDAAGGGYFDEVAKSWGPNANSMNAVGFTQISITNEEGFTFRVLNDTDGDVQVNILKATFVKL